MQPLIIEQTRKSPKIELKNGILNFTGCSIHEDPWTFFTPVMEWIEEYIQNPQKETIVNIKFEYIDSASVKTFFEALKLLEKLAKRKMVVVNWYFDFNDPEILELGEILQSKINIEFKFIENV